MFFGLAFLSEVHRQFSHSNADVQPSIFLARPFSKKYISQCVYSVSGHEFSQLFGSEKSALPHMSSPFEAVKGARSFRNTCGMNFKWTEKKLMHQTCMNQEMRYRVNWRSGLPCYFVTDNYFIHENLYIDL